MFSCLHRPTYPLHTPPPHLVERRHSLGELSLDLGQRLGPLQSLLQLLLGIIQTLLKLPVLLFALQEVRMRGTGSEGCWGWGSDGTLCVSPADSHLSVQRVFAGQLVLQFVFYVVERRRLPLGTQVSANRNKH